MADSHQRRDPRIGRQAEDRLDLLRIEVAGGAVTTLDGQPLRYNRRDTLLNPFFLAFGDSSRNWAALV